MKFKQYHWLGVAFLLAFLWLLSYGIETDCPDTAGYVYCAPDEK